MKKVYIKTTWIDNKTPINAANMNKIESAISDLCSSAISYSDLVKGEGIDINVDTTSKNVTISTDKTVMKSRTCTGFEVITEEQESYEENKLYFLTDSGTKKLKKIILNGIAIYEME